MSLNSTIETLTHTIEEAKSSKKDEIHTMKMIKGIMTIEITIHNRADATSNPDIKRIADKRAINSPDIMRIADKRNSTNTTTPKELTSDKDIGGTSILRCMIIQAHRATNFQRWLSNTEATDLMSHP